MVIVLSTQLLYGCRQAYFIQAGIVLAMRHKHSTKKNKLGGLKAPEVLAQSSYGEHVEQALNIIAQA